MDLVGSFGNLYSHAWSPSKDLRCLESAGTESTIPVLQVLCGQKTYAGPGRKPEPLHTDLVQLTPANVAPHLQLLAV